MKKYFQLLIFIFTILILSACTNDFPEPERIRPFFGLIASDIPYAENLDPYSRNSNIYSHRLSDGSLYATYYYKWIDYNNSSYIIINVSITESRSSSELHLQKQKQFYEDEWKITLTEDNVAVAGNISYENGRLFARDNIVVMIKTGFSNYQIDASKNLEYSISEIAYAIDKKIKRSKTYSSANKFKPVIKDIVFEKHPIPYFENLNVTLLVDPVESILQTHFYFPRSQFERTSIRSGVINLDTLCKYKNNEFKLNVFVVSKEGFCDDSTFTIQIKPWD